MTLSFSYIMCVLYIELYLSQCAFVTLL